jgi:hypothetical protein
MQVALAFMVVALVGIDEPRGKHAAGSALVAPMTKSGPTVAFEIRTFKVGSPDWRGKIMNSLQPIDRQEGAAIWALDPAGLKELLEYCQADPRSNVLQAPKMIARIGDPVRMSSETATSYVAFVKRSADGPPNQATHVAFEPQVDKVHTGIRVKVLSSELKAKALFAKIVVEENRLMAMHDALYSEALNGGSTGQTPHKGTVSLRDRLQRKLGIDERVINATIQVPEVESRRVEGKWLIPSEGALLVSMGPSSSAKRDNVIMKTQYVEHLLAITARPAEESAPAQHSTPAASLPKPIVSVLPRTD